MTNCPHCGCDIDPPKKGKPRSVPQHRRYFALIRAALYHWPEAHDFQPQTEEHLRRWLQAKAGYCKVSTINTSNMTPEMAVMTIAAALKKAGPFAFVKATDARLHIFAPDSVSFDKMEHKLACALFDEVAKIIEIEVGQRIDDMLRFTPRTKAAERIPEVAL